MLVADTLAEPCEKTQLRVKIAQCGGILCAPWPHGAPQGPAMTPHEFQRWSKMTHDVATMTHNDPVLIQNA